MSGVVLPVPEGDDEFTLDTDAEAFDGTTWWCDHTRQAPGQPVEHLPCPPECEIRHPMKVHVDSDRIE